MFEATLSTLQFSSDSLKGFDRAASCAGICACAKLSNYTLPSHMQSEAFLTIYNELAQNIHVAHVTCPQTCPKLTMINFPENCPLITYGPSVIRWPCLWTNSVRNSSYLRTLWNLDLIDLLAFEFTRESLVTLSKKIKLK